MTGLSCAICWMQHMRPRHSRLSGRGQLPALPWANMVGMRNRLVHACFDINRDVVWRTVTEDIPDLTDQLESLGLMEE